jgi:ubiquinone biosynthesis protein COQ4
VFVAGIALNAGAFPKLLAKIVADDAGFELAAEAPTIDSRSVDYDKLRALPETTLGGAYVRYLDRNQLDPDLFKPPPGLSKVPQWVVTRIRQTHDVWHALTGYGPDVEGEVALQAFSYAQLRVPSALLIALVGTVVKVPRAAPKVWRAYVRGKKAAFLPVVRFEDHWERPLADVQTELGIDAAA